MRISPRVFAVLTGLGATAVLAQEPIVIERENPDVTIRMMADPAASRPDEVVRKIPPSKPRRSTPTNETHTRDLANPGRGENADPGTAEPGTLPDPVPIPDVWSQPDPGAGAGAGPDPREIAGDLGEQVSDDVRNRGDEARRNNGPAGPREDRGPPDDRGAPDDRGPPAEPRQPGGPRPPGDRGPPGDRDPRDDRGPPREPRQPRDDRTPGDDRGPGRRPRG